MPIRILVVDAIATNRILLKVKLAAKDHQILTAENATSALPLMRINRPDIAVLGTGGSGMIQTIRSDPVGLDIPIILIGERDRNATNVSLLRLGADSLLAPPVSETALKQNLRQLLGQKRKLQAKLPEGALWGLSEKQQSDYQPH